MAPHTSTASLSLAAAVACGAVLYVYGASRKKAQHPLSSCGAAHGRARVFTLSAVDRTDAPGGKAPGPPGRPAAHYLDVATEAAGGGFG